MANYYQSYRSNYFKVKDIEKLKEIVDGIGAELWNSHSNEEYYAFGDLDSSGGYEMYYDDDDNEKDTCEEIQKILDDDQICIINSIGHEKLRYLDAGTSMITNNTIKYKNLFEETYEEYIEPIIKFEPNKEKWY